MVSAAGHVIVFGNEKGGSGKSTSAMHVAIALLQQGRTVGAIDLDSRQQSLARYIENRRGWVEANGLNLPVPDVRVVARSNLDSVAAAEREESTAFEAALNDLRARCDFVIVDSPGSDTFLARAGHAVADTLVTPLNDSFVDFDLFARVEPQTLKILGPSLYALSVWESRKRRAMSHRRTIDWVVVRNRVSTLDARNKRRVGAVLEDFSKRIGFRIGPGLSERVIYRELFPYGLTLLDMGTSEGKGMTLSQLAARQEVRELVASLQLPHMMRPVAPIELAEMAPPPIAAAS
jgi:chromosome partitioning protein